MLSSSADAVGTSLPNVKVIVDGDPNPAEVTLGMYLCGGFPGGSSGTIYLSQLNVNLRFNASLEVWYHTSSAGFWSELNVVYSTDM